VKLKGRTTFTSAELASIRALVAEKVSLNDQNDQKLVRDELRAIGFYISRFGKFKPTFTVEHLDGLIASSQIIEKL
jgi:hypothetical protein